MHSPAQVNKHMQTHSAELQLSRRVAPCGATISHLPLICDARKKERENGECSVLAWHRNEEDVTRNVPETDRGDLFGLNPRRRAFGAGDGCVRLSAGCVSARGRACASRMACAARRGNVWTLRQALLAPLHTPTLPVPDADPIPASAPRPSLTDPCAHAGSRVLSRGRENANPRNLGNTTPET